MSTATTAAATTATAATATKIIRELAERQHGVVARWQLTEAGLGTGLIWDRVRSGRLIRVHQGVFALGHRRLTRHGEWMAAVLACGPSAVLSHASAASLWGVRGSRGPIEVLRTSGNRRPHGVRVHQTRFLPTADVTRTAGIAVTTIERTAVDMAGRLDRRQMEHFLVEADRAGHLRWATLAKVLERPGGRKGIGRLRLVASRVDPRMRETRSTTEIDFFALCRDWGLSLPQVNVLVEGYLVDFHWPGERLIVETDSYSFHSDRIAFERDRKSTVVLSAAGYLVHRFTRQMVEDEPRPIMQLVRRSIEERAVVTR
jgi:very-short-patch-repair endonuclease